MTAGKQVVEERFKLTLRDVVSIFFYHKHTFVLTFLGVVLGALLLVVLSPAVYQTSARLVVKPRIDKPDIFQADASRMTTSDRVDQQTLNTVVHLLQSPDVLRAVVLEHDLATAGDETAVLEQIEILSGLVKVEPLSMSNIIEVSLKGRDPAVITGQLNSLLDGYIAYHIQVNQSLEGRLEFFDQQAQLFKNRYEQLGGELAKAYRQLNLASPESQADNRLALVRDLEARRASVVAELGRLQQRLQFLDSALNNVDTSAGLAGLPPQLRSSYPALVEMERSLAQLIINVQRARSDFLPDTKPTRDAEQQLANMQTQIRSYMESIIDSVEIDRDAKELELRQLGNKIEQARQGIGKLSANAVLLEQIKFEYQMAEENYRLYETKREEARINQEKDKSSFANVSIASRPLVPVHPWFPNKRLIMALAVVLGFLLAIAASTVSYLVNQTIRNPADVHLRTRVRLLGTLDTV